MASLEVGQRVVRSATWTGRDQDGGEGHLGTVVKLTGQDPNEPIPKGWAKVRWDNGYANKYQVGSSGTYDLALFDNAPAGVVHLNIVCDSCKMDPIAGIRWKCCDQSCPDYDLCTPCYMNDMHDLTHSFIRFDSRKETGTQVTPRFGEARTVSMGLCPEAEVSQGKDWEGEDEDGFGGTVLGVCPISERPRSGVSVCLAQGNIVKTYRVGYNGKMDLKATKAGTGVAFYHKHLPILGEELGLKVGDCVAITLDAETLQVMQQMSGHAWLPEMGKLFGKVALVTSINSRGNAEVTYPNRKEQPFTFHPDVLNKVPRLGKGDRVQINKDLNIVKNLQENSNHGWVDGMEKCLGMEGTVVNVDSNCNARVQLIGFEKMWSWHPCCSILVKKNSQDTGEEGAKLLADESGGADALVKALLTLFKTKVGNSSDSDEGDEATQLSNAAITGNVERVVEILSTSPEKANAKVGGLTALHRAAGYGHMEVVQALIGAGVDVDILDDAGNIPLIFSVGRDEPAITKYLVEKGADMNRGNDDGRRGIHQAACKGFVDCARVLIKLGCDVNVQDINKNTPLHDAVCGSKVDVIELLVKVPNLDVTLANKNSMTAFGLAAINGLLEPAELIAQHCPQSITVPRDDGNTILHICAMYNQVDVMKVVLAVKDHGLDVNTQDAEGITALYTAATEGHTDSMEFLVSLGADPNLQNKKGNSALHALANQADEDNRDRNEIKDTPTLRKIRKRFRDCGVDNSGSAALCYLVLNGASIDIESDRCRTPLYFVSDAKLKKTLKQIARGEKKSFRADDMSSWEDLGEDEDVKKGRLSSNAINDDEYEDIVKQNDGFCSTTTESPKRIRNDSAENEIGSTPAGNKKEGKPKVEVFDLVHEIKITDLDMGQVIGKGQFGVVHQASWRGTPVAVKKIDFTGSSKDQIEKEVAIHRRASHPNIVQMMALGYEGREAYLVMQLIEGASLATIIFPDRDDVKVPLDFAEKLQISREVLQAVTFMHGCNILHLDIKPANILVETVTLRPFVCDLGLAHIKNRNLMSQSSMIMKGTPSFMPPETLGATDPDYRHSNKHDIWSVAGTLVELFSMKRLWGNLVNPMALLARIVKGIMGKPDSLGAVDPKVRKILDPCFNQKPEKRPSAEDLLDQFNGLTP